MDREYLNQLENHNLQKVFLREENIFKLEEILSMYAGQLYRLRKETKGKENQDRVKENEMGGVFTEVCNNVNAFLEIQSGMPECRYTDFFNPKLEKSIALALLGIAGFCGYEGCSLASEGQTWSSLHYLINANLYSFSCQMIFNRFSSPSYEHIFKKINIPKKEFSLRTSFIPVAAHEYTHHVQHQSGITSLFTPRKFLVFYEGHAFGVTRHIAEIYKQREDNPAFEFIALNETFDGLKGAYLWLCHQLKKPTNQHLLITKASGGYRERRSDPHALGNALFSIWEAEEGKEIYKNALQSRLKIA